MRLVVLLPSSKLRAALEAIAAPLLAHLAALAAQLRATGCAAHQLAHAQAAAAALVQLLRCVMRFLDVPPLALWPAAVEGQPPISAHATELLLREAWATLEAVREAAGRQPSLGAALCDFYEAAMRAGASGARRGEGGTALLEWLPRIVAALHALLATHLASGTDAEAPPAEADPADMACQLLGALATAVECFGGAAEASGFLGEMLARTADTLGSRLATPERIAASPAVSAAYLDLFYRSAIFAEAALYRSPRLVGATLALVVPSLRQPQRELLRAACTLLARLASATAELTHVLELQARPRHK